MSTQTRDRIASPRWDAAAEEHHVALAAYQEAALRLDHAEWERPWATGKWTPAQITEHLTLTYESLLADLCEGRPMKARLGPWRQKITRWIFLPHILFHRTFPLRVVAPRELRPERARAKQADALRILEQMGERFEDELGRAFRAGGGCLTHPYFGQVDPVRGLRFIAVHMEHHRRQIEKCEMGFQE
jgi:hypothetical protein